MKIEGCEHVGNVESIREPSVPIETIRASYLLSGGLIDSSFVAYNYNKSGRVYKTESEYRKVSTREEWDLKI